MLWFACSVCSGTFTKNLLIDSKSFFVFKSSRNFSELVLRFRSVLASIYQLNYTRTKIKYGCELWEVGGPPLEKSQNFTTPPLNFSPSYNNNFDSLFFRLWMRGGGRRLLSTRKFRGPVSDFWRLSKTELTLNLGKNTTSLISTVAGQSNFFVPCTRTCFRRKQWSWF